MINPARAKLKAFIRLDYSGRVIPGSMVFRKAMPRTGRWMSIDAQVCCNPTPAPTLVSIAAVADPTSIAVDEDSTLTVTATYDDDSTTDVTVASTYASSDEAIATVSETGVVTGVAEGSATITVTYDSKTTTVDVTVTAAA